MTAITLTNHELLQLKLLLRDIELIQKMNSPFDNEAIEILSFKIIEHLNTDETLKENHIVDTNEMVSSQASEQIAIDFAEWMLDYNPTMLYQKTKKELFQEFLKSKQ